MVEYDGAYWHSGTSSAEVDRRKSTDLSDAGWTVVRVRQSPLTPLSDYDMVIDVDRRPDWKGIVQRLDQRLLALCPELQE